MRLEKCCYCSCTIYPGHGIQFVRNDCKIFQFCRSKCHKNFKMKRNPRKVKWTKAYRKLHGKELTKDTTFEFERRRNRPERYDRNVVQNTLKAIKKIEEVRISREAKLWENRMKGNKDKQMKEDTRELEQSIHLVNMQEDPRHRRALPMKAVKTDFLVKAIPVMLELPPHWRALPVRAAKMKVEVSISKQQ